MSENCFHWGYERKMNLLIGLFSIFNLSKTFLLPFFEKIKTNLSRWIFYKDQWICITHNWLFGKESEKKASSNSHKCSLKCSIHFTWTHRPNKTISRVKWEKKVTQWQCSMNVWAKGSTHWKIKRGMRSCELNS